MRPQPIDAPSTATPDEDAALRRWAAGGGLWLSGRPDGPCLAPPAGAVSALEAIASHAAADAQLLGANLSIDPIALTVERAAAAGLHRRGMVSCGGATRLLAAADGWIAASLARPSDVELVPAWLELDFPTQADPWTVVAERVARHSGHDLRERAHLIGLPVAVVGETLPPHVVDGLPIEATSVPGEPTPPRRLSDLLVVDLGALWAGPLCAALFARAGATVVKVESAQRPDGARLGPAAFFDRLNSGKRSAVLPLGEATGPAVLRQVLAAADVVIEASRPRALRQLGIEADELLARGPRVWISITGHGRRGARGERVAFGDDAAVAGGLVCWEGSEPRFCADALADPAAGLTGFAAALHALTRGGRWLLDVSMAGVAAHLARSGRPAEVGGLLAEPPPAIPSSDPAPPAGEATEWLLARAGVS